jgi:DNA-binding transcriptional LysR family regulator
MPVVVALRESHPELQIDLLTGVRSLDITRREADFAVRVSNVRPPGINRDEVGSWTSADYAGRGWTSPGIF